MGYSDMISRVRYSRVRYGAQDALKSIAHSVGLEIRYAFQNPSVSSASLYYTEGYDSRVLRGASRMLSEKRIHCVMSEVGFIGDQHHTPFDEVYAILHTNGYRLAGLYEATYYRTGECNFANALFVYPSSE